MLSVSEKQVGYFRRQTYVIPLLILSWMVHAHHSEPFKIVMGPLVVLAVPLLELAAILLCVGLLLSMCFIVLAGDRVENWSSIGNAVVRMYEHVFVGVPRSGLPCFGTYAQSNVQDRPPALIK